MTVVATLISRTCTVHASDSLLTVITPTGEARFVEWDATKIVPVRHFRGAIAYYGLAGQETGWQTLSWLRTQSAQAGSFASAQNFGEHLATALQSELVRLGVAGSAGIGLHFSVYERVDDHWIPELFHVSNWLNPAYVALRPGGVGCTRETWGLIRSQSSSLEHGDRARRLEVHRYLQNEGWLRFNNGDPAMFNTVANALQDAVLLLGERGRLRELGPPEHIAIAHRSVELVAQLQREVGRPDSRRVGGRTHNLAVTPDGLVTSTSGDAE